MYRNLYDTDHILYSPEGRLYQIEYAGEAIKQGTCAVAIKSKDYVVVCGLKKNLNKLSFHQDKIFKIDEHIGATMSGLTADAKLLTKFMRNECLLHKYLYNEPLSINKLVLKVADKYQKNTQKSSRRAFGVGLIIIGYDKEPYIFETKPNGSYFEYIADAFGARSHASKTYLENYVQLFQDSTLDELVIHALKALKAALASEQQLTTENAAVAFIGKDRPWTELQGNVLADVLKEVNRVTQQQGEEEQPGEGEGQGQGGQI